MKKSILILLVIALGCHDRTDIALSVQSKPIVLPGNTCSSSLRLDKSVAQQEGRVSFRDDLNMYYINVYTGGIDSSLSGLVCNMPDELKVVGKKVVFDGDYYTDTQMPNPRLGGETMRYLILTLIK